MMNSIVEEIETVTPTTVTIRFQWDADVLPGQFIMVWLPGIGEIPISLSHTGRKKGITVKKFGPTSQALTELKEGDRIFFRGPYGNTFRKDSGRILVIGGGSGMAGLLPLIDEKSHGLVSARTSEELLFADRFNEGNVTLATDDGSAGIKGFAVDALKQLDLKHYSHLYVCGPELMLKTISDYIAGKGVKADFSLERTMKCGIGICDSCSINGFQLCKDGPVFTEAEIAEMTEFGNSRLTESGRRVRL